MILRRSLVALLAVLVSIPLLSAAARPEAPTPEVVSEVRDVTERAVAAPTWPYGPMEVQRWYNATHDPNIDRPTAARLTAYMNAVVENRLRDYLLAVYLNALPRDVWTVVRNAAIEFGIPVADFTRVIRCESGGNPNAVNRTSGALGLGQHLPRYYAGRAAVLGYSFSSWSDPTANARVSAWLWRTSGPQNWSCY